MVEWVKALHVREAKAVGLGLRACTEAEPTELTVTLPPAVRGRPCKVKAELVSCSGDDRVEVKVLDHSDGTFTCRWGCTVSKHRVTIT